MLTAPVAQLSKLSAAQARPHVNKAIKARYNRPPCYHILFCLGKKKEWAGQIQNRANHYFDCEAMQVAVAAMLKLVGAESTAAPGDGSESET